MTDTHVLDTLKVNSYVSSMDHDVFIDEDIENEAYYRSVISTLNKASERDTIRFIISSNGGFGSTAMTLAHAMDSCAARKVGVLCGNVKSAATIIALHCDEWEVGEGCDWLAHTASFGLGGEAHKVKVQHDHEQKLIRKLLFREYEGFYTEDEIEHIANGNDSLLFAEDVRERLQRFVAHHQNKQTQAMQSMFDEQLAQEDEALEAGLQHLLKQGKATPEEIAVIKKLTPLLDEAFDKGEVDFENLGNSGEEESLSEELTITSTEGDVYGVAFECSVEASGEVSIFNIEVCSEDNAFFIDAEDLFDCYGLRELKEIADQFSIPYVHNIGAKRLAARIEEYFVKLINEHLQNS